MMTGKEKHTPVGIGHEKREFVCLKESINSKIVKLGPKILVLFNIRKHCRT